MPEARLVSFIYYLQPLQNFYRRMLCGCSSSFVERVLDTLTNYLIHDGPKPSESEIEICLGVYFFHKPPNPGTQPNMSISMEFALEMLKARLSSKSTAQLLISIYDRLARKSRSADKKNLLLKFGLQWGLQLKELRPDHQLGSVLPEIVLRWTEDLDHYEHLLVLGLRHGFGGSPDDISDGYLKAINCPRTKLSPQLRWRLLRLFCQYVPRKGIDIETSSDFKCLADQEWSYEISEELEREHAIMFLSRLYKANPDYDFLRAPLDHKSIYSMRYEPRDNFSVERFLTAYQGGDADVEQRARHEIVQLQQKAATSRDQQHWALLAMASAHYAIATGDLEVYADIILWQRFIRDPVAVRLIFAPDAILTVEGVALLSGIPTEESTLGMIRQRLGIANRILESFNEAHQKAQKEPFHADWSALKSVYTDVHRERVSRAKQIKLQPHESKQDLFRIIWEGTADLVHNIGYAFLKQVKKPIHDLLKGFSGPSLISASESLLDFATRWRMKEEYNSDQERIASTMEILSYKALSDLSRGDTPMLARDLIRRAIIENPEASSWHRRFLPIRYMRNLPAEAARNKLLSFATAVEEKLEEQSYVKMGDEETPKSSPPQSVINVSTAKYLAQLLNNADFISSDTAVEILTEMFKSATHIDIRIAIVDSLLSLLNAILNDDIRHWRSNPMIQKIFSTMDSVIFIAGNVNQRRPVGEVDWAEAGEKMTIPATTAGLDIPSLFKTILHSTGELFTRLVLPTLHHSQEQHRRWFSLFLAKHKPDLDADILPCVPITPQVWEYMLEHQGHLLPSVAINEFSQYLLLHLRMPTDIKNLNRILQSHETLRKMITPLSWRQVLFSLLGLIVAPIKKASPMADLMGAVVSQASLLLDNYEKFVEQWSYLMDSLGPTHVLTKSPSRDGNDYDKDMEKAWNCWREVIPTLAQKLVAHIEEKLSSSAGREDFALPSTFALQLWYEDDRRFAIALNRCLSSFLSRNEGDTLLWTTLVDDIFFALSATYKTDAARLYVAVHVCDIDLDHDHPTVEALQLIRVKAATRCINLKRGAFSKGELEKTKSTEMGGLLQRLLAVMDRWGYHGAPSERAQMKDTVLRWKQANKALWEEACCYNRFCVICEEEELGGV
ncbi:hypothetical protein GGS21DRAFT_541313 [Xylaria nigripes]|nr:hypothetical protein GGS21DRAFT_541313 [Xylaria nigripes]